MAIHPDVASGRDCERTHAWTHSWGLALCVCVCHSGCDGLPATANKACSRRGLCPTALPGTPYPKATGPPRLREGTLRVVSACLCPNPLSPTPSDHPHRRQASTCPGLAAGERRRSPPACPPPLCRLCSDKELTLVSVGVWETLGGLAARTTLSPPLASPPGWHQHLQAQSWCPHHSRASSPSPYPVCVCLCLSVSCPQHRVEAEMQPIEKCILGRTSSRHTPSTAGPVSPGPLQHVLARLASLWAPLSLDISFLALALLPHR